MPRKVISFANLEPRGGPRSRSSLGFSFTTPIYTDADKQEVLSRVKENYDRWKEAKNIPVYDEEGGSLTYEQARGLKGASQRVRGILMKRAWAEMRQSKGDMWQKGANDEASVRGRREAWCQKPVSDCLNDCNTRCNRKWAKKDAACNYLTQKGKISGFHAAAGRGAFNDFPMDLNE